MYSTHAVLPVIGGLIRLSNANAGLMQLDVAYLCQFKVDIEKCASSEMLMLMMVKVMMVRLMLN